MKAAPWALIAYATGCEFGALAMSFMTESLDYWNAYWEEIARHRDLAEGERQKKSRYYILVGCEDRFLDVSRLLCFGKRNARDCAYTISRTGHSAAGVCSWVAPFSGIIRSMSPFGSPPRCHAAITTMRASIGNGS